MSVEIHGPAVPGSLAAPLAVAGCATAAVARCLDAAADLAEARTGRRPAVALDTGHVAAAVRAEALLRDPAGAGVGGFAPLSRLWPAADGWVRTHANYPWHRAALLAALGTDEAGVAAAIEARPAEEVERLVYGAGGLAVAAREPGRWPDPEPDAPLVCMTPLPGTARPLAAAGPLPASGIRVLDLTRVIAGPAGTRMLGALGADVLRVDDPARPELPMHAVDGVVGKASTVLDAGTPAGLDTLHRLLAGADVLVTGYRPGALRRFGLDPDQVADRHPGTVVVTLSAWGTTGPWGARRGFDSLVQVATGIARRMRDGTGRPGALPCQLLDHATGYLAAAGALAALAGRARTGAAAHVEVSLARTARWLLDTPADPAAPDDTPVAPYLAPLGNGWTGVRPPGTLDGAPLTWPHLPPSYGTAAAAWG
ncbi:CoA transferase [Dactylosporangium aurantiacum]|uniref:CoA transferase n=1 Tax=Dactylosporangium aurantiacum TaxID=35754 RepID=A0A9Q9MAQ0_9ACTN|nr:CoA transferase [Dactylosporangium aurantiacum]MDG6103401.1 CoA transferase [Dactylosporangium aurantiacum]UWZ52088.1 CoA transferase [Dactylosporangium aurantiacum]